MCVRRDFAGQRSEGKTRGGVLTLSTARPLQLCFGLILFTLSVGSSAVATTLDFENLTDSDALTTQYSGLAFSTAIVLTAETSLNEFEFPPQSGVNVVSDNEG